MDTPEEPQCSSDFSGTRVASGRHHQLSAFPRWIDLNAIQLCGALEEVDLGWAVVGDVAVGGAFGSLVFQSAAFDGAGAAVMSTGRVESLDDFTDRGLDRPGESAGGKTPPGR